MGTRRWDDSEGPSLFSSSGGCRQMEQFFGVLPWEICLHAPLFPQEKGLLCWEGHPAQGSQPGGAGKVAWSSAQPAVWGAQRGSGNRRLCSGGAPGSVMDGCVSKVRHQGSEG